MYVDPGFGADVTGTAAVTLVPLAAMHRERTRAWANDPELMRLMDRARAVSEDEHAAWFDALERRDDCAYFAIELAGAHVGNVWLWAIDTRHRKAEVRIVVGEASARGHGVGARAIELATRHAFDQLQLHR